MVLIVFLYVIGKYTVDIKLMIAKLKQFRLLINQLKSLTDLSYTHTAESAKHNFKSVIIS